eukprot:g3374.t1
MVEFGYLFVRGLFKKSAVNEAGNVVRNFLRENPEVSHITKDGKIFSGVTLTGCTPVTCHPKVRNVLESNKIYHLMSKIFNSPVKTFDQKWMRVVAPGEETSIHSDGYFFDCLSNPEMMTVWTPLCDVPVERALVVCKGSHLLPMSDYEEEMADELPRSFTEFVENNVDSWYSENFQAGDVLIFDERTIHGAPGTKSKSKKKMHSVEDLRISCDTRWQPLHLFRGHHPSGK